MDMSDFGRPTFHTRVEAWECDHNQHWNVRNYMRSFDYANMVIADMAGQPRDPAAVTTHHSRYHRELFQASQVEIRSAVLADGPFAGSIVHVLGSNGKMAATALQTPGFGHQALPTVPSASVPLAMPRGVDGKPFVQEPVVIGAGELVAEHAFVQPREVDHTGHLTIDRVMRRIATASNNLIYRLGFTVDYGRAHKISRMGVELKVTQFAPITVGMRLQGVARVIHAAGKSLIVRHHIFTPDGTLVAAGDQCLVFVDMEKRRAIEVPAFLQQNAG